MHHRGNEEFPDQVDPPLLWRFQISSVDTQGILNTMLPACNTSKCIVCQVMKQRLLNTSDTAPYIVYYSQLVINFPKPSRLKFKETCLKYFQANEKDISTS